MITYCDVTNYTDYKFQYQLMLYDYSSRSINGL